MSTFADVSRPPVSLDPKAPATTGSPAPSAADQIYGAGANGDPRVAPTPEQSINLSKEFERLAAEVDKQLRPMQETMVLQQRAMSGTAGTVKALNEQLEYGVFGGWRKAAALISGTHGDTVRLRDKEQGHFEEQATKMTAMQREFGRASMPLASARDKFALAHDPNGLTEEGKPLSAEQRKALIGEAFAELTAAGKAATAIYARDKLAHAQDPNGVNGDGRPLSDAERKALIAEARVELAAAGDAAFEVNASGLIDRSQVVITSKQLKAAHAQFQRDITGHISNLDTAEVVIQGVERGAKTTAVVVFVVGTGGTGALALAGAGLAVTGVQAGTNVLEEAHHVYLGGKSKEEAFGTLAARVYDSGSESARTVLAGDQGLAAGTKSFIESAGNALAEEGHDLVTGKKSFGTVLGDVSSSTVEDGFNTGVDMLSGGVGRVATKLLGAGAKPVISSTIQRVVAAGVLRGGTSFSLRSGGNAVQAFADIHAFEQAHEGRMTSPETMQRAREQIFANYGITANDLAREAVLTTISDAFGSGFGAKLSALRTGATTVGRKLALVGAEAGGDLTVATLQTEARAGLTGREATIATRFQDVAAVAVSTAVGKGLGRYAETGTPEAPDGRAGATEATGNSSDAGGSEPAASAVVVPVVAVAAAGAGGGRSRASSPAMSGASSDGPASLAQAIGVHGDPGMRSGMGGRGPLFSTDSVSERGPVDRSHYGPGPVPGSVAPPSPRGTGEPAARPGSPATRGRGEFGAGIFEPAEAVPSTPPTEGSDLPPSSPPAPTTTGSPATHGRGEFGAGLFEPAEAVPSTPPTEGSASPLSSPPAPTTTGSPATRGRGEFGAGIFEPGADPAPARPAEAPPVANTANQSSVARAPLTPDNGPDVPKPVTSIPRQLISDEPPLGQRIPSDEMNRFSDETGAEFYHRGNAKGTAEPLTYDEAVEGAQHVLRNENNGGGVDAATAENYLREAFARNPDDPLFDRLDEAAYLRIASDVEALHGEWDERVHRPLTDSPNVASPRPAGESSAAASQFVRSLDVNLSKAAIARGDQLTFKEAVGATEQALSANGENVSPQVAEQRLRATYAEEPGNDRWLYLSDEARAELAQTPAPDASRQPVPARAMTEDKPLTYSEAIAGAQRTLSDQNGGGAISRADAEDYLRDLYAANPQDPLFAQLTNGARDTLQRRADAHRAELPPSPPDEVRAIPEDKPLSYREAIAGAQRTLSDQNGGGEVSRADAENYLRDLYAANPQDPLFAQLTDGARDTLQRRVDANQDASGAGRADAEDGPTAARRAEEAAAPSPRPRQTGPNAPKSDDEARSWLEDLKFFVAEVEGSPNAFPKPRGGHRQLTGFTSNEDFRNALAQYNARFQRPGGSVTDTAELLRHFDRDLRQCAGLDPQNPFFTERLTHRGRQATGIHQPHELVEPERSRGFRLGQAPRAQAAGRRSSEPLSPTELEQRLDRIVNATDAYRRASMDNSDLLRATRGSRQPQLSDRETPEDLGRQLSRIDYRLRSESDDGVVYLSYRDIGETAAQDIRAASNIPALRDHPAFNLLTPQGRRNLGIFPPEGGVTPLRPPSWSERHPGLVRMGRVGGLGALGAGVGVGVLTLSDRESQTTDQSNGEGGTPTANPLLSGSNPDATADTEKEKAAAAKKFDFGAFSDEFLKEALEDVRRETSGAPR